MAVHLVVMELSIVRVAIRKHQLSSSLFGKGAIRLDEILSFIVLTILIGESHGLKLRHVLGSSSGTHMGIGEESLLPRHKRRALKVHLHVLLLVVGPVQRVATVAGVEAIAAVREGVIITDVRNG